MGQRVDGEHASRLPFMMLVPAPEVADVCPEYHASGAMPSKGGTVRHRPQLDPVGDVELELLENFAPNRVTGRLALVDLATEQAPMAGIRDTWAVVTQLESVATADFEKRRHALDDACRRTLDPTIVRGAAAH